MELKGIQEGGFDSKTIKKINDIELVEVLENK